MGRASEQKKKERSGEGEESVAELRVCVLGVALGWRHGSLLLFAVFFS